MPDFHARFPSPYLRRNVRSLLTILRLVLAASAVSPTLSALKSTLFVPLNFAT